MQFIVHSLKPGTDVIDGIFTLRHATSEFLLHYCRVLRNATGSDVRAYHGTVTGKRVL